MLKQINKDNLEIKYLLRIYNLIESYPNSTDILFDLATDNYILEQNEFDFNYAKTVLIEKINKEEYYNLAEELINKKYLEKIEKGKKVFYKLLKHPWS